jgi:hypothetical protein
MSTSEEPQGTTTNPDPENSEIDWKAKSREWERRAKENKAAADRLAEIEESQKTDLQKAVARAAALESELAGYKKREQVAKWASEIAKDSQIPASALRGDTREELEAHFKELEALIPKQQPKRTPVPTGKPSGEGGGSAAVAALRQLRGTA